MFKFITHRPFWVNALAALALAFLIFFLLLQMLGILTKHGEHLTVPLVLGKNTNDAVSELKKAGFDVEITDSVYTDTIKNGVVLKQMPDANSTVKVNRTVYLTVNRVTPPQVELPKLEGLSSHFAIDQLHRAHLKLADTIFKTSYMIGSVIEMLYNGQPIKAGAKVQWGSGITLVVGAGLEEERMLVPDLLNMSFADAKVFLEGKGISMGYPIAEGAIHDTARAFVVKQNPPCYDEEHMPQYIYPGQMMDVWISEQKAVIPLNDSAQKPRPVKDPANDQKKP